MKKWKLKELVEDLNFENDSLVAEIEVLEKRIRYLEWYSGLCETFLNIEKENNNSKIICFCGNSNYSVAFHGSNQ